MPPESPARTGADDRVDAFSLPDHAANTQSKGGEKKAVGGGGSAGMAARLGATAEVRWCHAAESVCVAKSVVAPTKVIALAPIAAVQKRECVLCKALFNVRAPRAQIMEHVESKHAKQARRASARCSFCSSVDSSHAPSTFGTPSSLRRRALTHASRALWIRSSPDTTRLEAPWLVAARRHHVGL